MTTGRRGCSSGCSCPLLILVRPHSPSSGEAVNLLLNGPFRTWVNDGEHDHDGLAVWVRGLTPLSAALGIQLFFAMPGDMPWLEVDRLSQPVGPRVSGLLLARRSRS